MAGAVYGKADSHVLVPGENHVQLNETPAERDARMGWWRKAKFGMFIHFGLYSGLGGEFKGRAGGAEWLQTNLGLDTETYAAEAMPLFNPAPGCTEEWAKLAKVAGCRYMVLTTKHHDGYALFDSKVSDYTTAKTKGRDIVREFTESARKNGLRVGFYHSVIDWHHPSYDNTICRGLCYPSGQAKMLRERGVPRDHAAYQAFLQAQVKELLTNYGKVDILWWDYSQGDASGERGWKAPTLISMAHKLQPGIVMNNRLYAYSSLKSESDAAGLDLRCGDFMTPEKRLLAMGVNGVDWEACMTLGNHWGFNRRDKAAYKSVPTLLRSLQRCAALGGNLLLNISPREDGSVPPPAVEAFWRIGRWMEVNGESVYESVPVPELKLPEEWLASRVGSHLYLFAPVIKTEEAAVTVRIPASVFGKGKIEPVVLGQPDCKVQVNLVKDEESGESMAELAIPASAWVFAIEGLPVIKLTAPSAR